MLTITECSPRSWAPGELLTASLQALDAALLPASEKAGLRRRFEAELLGLLSELRER